MNASLRVVPADERPHTNLGWLDSRHSFNFGEHVAPDNAGHGLLLVSNDDRVAPGKGFGSHRHRDMEIVSWVLTGRLRHEDSEGNVGELAPGIVQRMSAGTGIAHSEMNGSATDEVHFVQMWVPPDTRGITPGYEERDVTDLLAGGGLQLVAAGPEQGGAITIHQRDAALWAGRLGAREVVEVPDGSYVHLFVALGGAQLEGAGSLLAGDAVRAIDAGPLTLTADAGGAEVLVWVTA